jgi:hypothetical protein
MRLPGWPQAARPMLIAPIPSRRLRWPSPRRGDRRAAPATGPSHTRRYRKRVVIRWRRPAPGDESAADVLGTLEEADDSSLAVRTPDGKLVVVPARLALAGKVVRPPPARHRGGGPAPR